MILDRDLAVNSGIDNHHKRDFIDIEFDQRKHLFIEHQVNHCSVTFQSYIKDTVAMIDVQQKTFPQEIHCSKCMKPLQLFMGLSRAF